MTYRTNRTIMSAAQASAITVVATASLNTQAFDGTSLAPRQFICALGLTLASRFGRRNALSNQEFRNADRWQISFRHYAWNSRKRDFMLELLQS